MKGKRPPVYKSEIPELGVIGFIGNRYRPHIPFKYVSVSMDETQLWRRWMTVCQSKYLTPLYRNFLLEELRNRRLIP